MKQEALEGAWVSLLTGHACMAMLRLSCLVMAGRWGWQLSSQPLAGRPGR